MALEALSARPNLEDNEELFSRLSSQLTGPQKQLIETSQWARDYVTTLTSMSLEDLHAQPHKLTQEDSAVEREIMTLAFKEYPTFIRAEKCRSDIGDSFVKMEDQLNNLSQSLPDFEDLCKEFSTEAKALTEERQKTEKVLEDLDVLVDIFEIPQLMDTCVRNGYYSEAMDLTSHVSLLLMRYNNIPIIQNIHEKVQRSSDMMLIQLISLLRGPIKLPAAMNVIGYLRQMSSFETENELRILFLRCRGDYLNQRIEHVKKVRRDSFEYIKQYIDVIREQVFEITTQYSSMFSDKLYGSTDDLTQSGTTEMLLTAGATLSDYITYILEEMRRTIEEHLVNIKDISQLSSLLTQLMYCGMSLGRVGLDFRSLFAMRFQDAMLKLTQSLIDDAKKGFLDAITKAKTENIPPSQWMATKSSSKPPTEETPEGQSRQQIVSQLIEYPVIAVFTNAILSLFNELRLLAPIALVQPINSYLEAAHLEIAQQIQIYAAPYLLTDSSTKQNIKTEQIVIRSFASGYIRSCVPYLRQCLLDGIYADVYLEDISSSDRLESEMKDILPVLGELVNVKEEAIEIQAPEEQMV
ncbi:Dor1-like family-domain-containing protein [Umbelopsis sp. AD052]|nr:Dor1-like family-domain-containing protein [Umbelopsis sp. AD052]